MLRIKGGSHEAVSRVLVPFKVALSLRRKRAKFALELGFNAAFHPKVAVQVVAVFVLFTAVVRTEQEFLRCWNKQVQKLKQNL